MFKKNWRKLPHKHKYHYLTDGHGNINSKRVCYKCGLEEWLYLNIDRGQLHWGLSPSEKFKEFENYRFNS